MVCRENLQQGVLKDLSDCQVFLFWPAWNTAHLFSWQRKKTRVKYPYPPWGGRGVGYPLRGYPIVYLFQVVVKTFLQKFFRRFFLLSSVSSAKIQVMQKIWIPRSLRWTTSERQAKKIQAKNNREIRLMFWRESQALREQIQKEISEKVLAKRAAIE